MIGDGGGQLLHAHLVQALADLGRVHGRVEDVARLAAGAAHQDGAHALVVVAVHRAGALRRLVVGVGVDAQEAAALGCAVSIVAQPRGREHVVRRPVDRPSPDATHPRGASPGGVVVEGHRHS